MDFLTLSRIAVALAMDAFAPRLATDAKNEEEALVHYRRVRDEIRGFVKQLISSVSYALEPD